MGAIKRTASDAWFSDCIRHRDGWSCRKCHKYFPEGSRQGLDSAHMIYARASKITRWNADNCMALCMGCHKWTSEHPFEATEWLTSELGEGLIQLVREKHRTHLKVNAALRKEISKHYREEYRRMVASQSTDLVSWN